jgi:hypothetical protein
MLFDNAGVNSIILQSKESSHFLTQTFLYATKEIIQTAQH